MFELTILLICSFSSITTVCASSEVIVDFQGGVEHYEKADFEASAKAFEKFIASGGEYLEAYLNLGDAYFENSQVGLALVNYSRAVRAYPRSESARSKLNTFFTTTGLQAGASEMVLEEEVFLKPILDNFSLTEIEIIFLIALVLFLLLLIVGNLSSALGAFYQLCKWLFAIVILFVISLFLIKSNAEIWQPQAIVTQLEATVLSSADEGGEKLFALSEGQRVYLREKKEGWVRVESPSGESGWMDLKEITVI